MFDKLIDLFKDWLGFFQFVAVVDQFERGVILERGVLRRHVEPGIVWFWPCAYQQLLRHPIVVDTQDLAAQSLTTADDISVTLTGLLTYRVTDVERVLLHVQGERQALVDSAMGIIGSAVLKSTWAEVITPDFWNKVTIEVRRRAKRYGIEIEQVAFRDLTKGRSLRIWNSTEHALEK
jgi:regulator of protease activity HflC (stomatin/prohibitin superfamily)